MNEVETKILGVDADEVKQKLAFLEAEASQNARLTVDWYGPKGLTHMGDDPWFLRVRSYNNEKHEVTWKGKSDVLGVSRIHKEINFTVSDKNEVMRFFEELNLEKYAHQEKNRTSWRLKDWKFDLDQYPGMPAYLEIEGQSEKSIQEAIKLLGQQNKTATPLGERDVITKNYGLNWFDMRF